MTDTLYYPAGSALPFVHGGSEKRRFGGWLFLILMLAAIMVARSLIWHLGVSIPQQTIASSTSVLLVMLLALFAWKVSQSQGPIPSVHGFKGRIIIMLLWVVVLTGWGLARGNIPNTVFKEALIFVIGALCLFLGRYDAVWKALTTPAALVFYLGFALVILTCNTPGVVTTFEGSSQADIRDIPRHMNTIGFECRVILDLGLLMGALGLVQARTDPRRLILLAALPIFAFVHGIIFEFRGTFATVAELIALYAIVLPIIQKRFPVRTIVVFAILGTIGLAAASRTEAFAGVMRRFHNEPLFGTRLSEADAFFKDMGTLDLTAGRGMGGWYRGPIWAKGIFYKGEWQWRANHFGFLGFVLRGGVFFLLFVLSFVVPVILPKDPRWYQNQYNLAALVLTPIFLFGLLVNPIALEPDAFFYTFVFTFCLARFSTPVSDTQPWSTAEPTLPDGYEYSS